MSETKYDNNSIERLEGPDRIRLRPAATLGSDGLDGAKHGVTEILGNSLDEASSGYGDRMDIEIHEDGSLRVRDYGRGVPLGWNENKQEWNYFLIYEEMYAGAKYDSSAEALKGITDWSKFDPKDYNYLFSVGMNGLGAMATQCSSEWFNVSSIRDGVKSTMKFEKGYSVLDELLVENIDEPNGTDISWKPDPEVFKDTNISESWVRNKAIEISCLAEMEVHFTGKSGSKEVFERGQIKDLFVALGGMDESDVEGIDTYHLVTHEDTPDGKGVLVAVSDIVMAPGVGENFFYNNKVSMNGGIHQDALDTALNNFFLQRGNEVGVRLRLSDWNGMLSFVVSLQSNKFSPRGQTKDSMDDAYAYDNIRQNITNLLNTEWARGNQFLIETVENAVKNAEIRIQQSNLESELREVKKVTNKKRGTPDKFVSCSNYTKKNPDNELWLVEGDSAGGSFKLARDSKFQCMLPLRGKSLNVYKSNLSRIFKNQEIINLTQILGAGVDAGMGDNDLFNLDKLRCNKIVIASDADVDGYHIKMLIFLIFYKLFPQLLYNGNLYMARPPLYSVVLRDGTHIYCNDETEVKEAEEKNRGNIKRIARFKGLGEMDPADLRRSTVDPETRNPLVQIKIDPNDSELVKSIEALFGDNTRSRKQLILGDILGVDLEGAEESISDIVDFVRSNEDWEMAEVEKIEV